MEIIKQHIKSSIQCNILLVGANEDDYGYNTTKNFLKQFENTILYTASPEFCINNHFYIDLNDVNSVEKITMRFNLIIVDIAVLCHTLTSSSPNPHILLSQLLESNGIVVTEHYGFSSNRIEDIKTRNSYTGTEFELTENLVTLIYADPIILENDYFCLTYYKKIENNITKTLYKTKDFVLQDEVNDYIIKNNIFYPLINFKKAAEERVIKELKKYFKQVIITNDTYITYSNLIEQIICQK